jgi:cytochrome c oxidase assembly protein subunit 15
MQADALALQWDRKKSHGDGVARDRDVGNRSSSDVGARSVAAWLFACCALVFAMVVVGGVTRLTHSGLSIVEWQPIIGTLPPLTDAAWQEAFAKYRQTPEFRLVNHAMDVHAFKGIFWWEYFHRLLGRAIGVVFLVPLAWFALRRRVSRELAKKLGAIFALGGLQGAMGWYMVQSGLVDDPRVSHFRLTAHLGLALAIFAAMLWIALSIVRQGAGGVVAVSDAAQRAGARLRHAGACIAALVFVMALTGGLVAGIRAGFAYNTFPSMNGHVVPPEIMMLEPWYLNPLYNMATVQFDHRAIAWLLAFAVPAFAVAVLRSRTVSRAAKIGTVLVVAMLAVQIALGIATLLLRVPVTLAALHQAGAVLLFAAVLNVAHALRTTPSVSRAASPAH